MITFIHIALAYAGMIIHLLIKLERATKKQDFSFKTYFKTIAIPTVINIIAIPVLLIMMGDSSLTEILPINNVTSVLAGYQTQSIFKSLMDRTNFKKDE